jgi:hypothetical protein
MTSRSSLVTLSTAPLFAFALVFGFEAAAQSEDRYSGTWGVRGMTTDLASGDQRRIEGHVVLAKKGDGWSASSELSTEFPTQAGAVHTDVIGNGEGVAKGDGLEGTAHTQLVIGAVPGVDTNFAFVPRQVGPRIVSKWKAHFEADGTLVVELTNEPEKGETYRPTKTVLKGNRVAMPSDPAKN